MTPGRNRKDSKGNKLPESIVESGSNPGSQQPSPNSIASSSGRKSSAESNEGASSSPFEGSEERKTCPCPAGCIIAEPIDENNPEDAVRVTCSNPECHESNWVHLVCFEIWEQQVLTYVKNSGRARGWPENRRNIWTKRGTDLAFKVCECRCGHGQMKKDLNYAPAETETIEEEEQDDGSKDEKQATARKQRRRTNSKQLPTIGRANSISDGNGHPNHPPPQQHSPGATAPPPRFRSRTMSLGSAAGLTPSHPAMANGEQSNNNSHAEKANRKRSDTTGYSSRTDYFHDRQVSITGSIFMRRDSISAFYKVLPKWKVNGVHIKMEDDCPQGNDDTRIFLLTTLGDHQMREVTCLLCSQSMPVYDRYPLVDGTFFLSPINHAQLGIPVRYEARDSFLLACCLSCLETASGRLACLRCGARNWFLGSNLMLGTLYSYDILSSSPCCPPECRSCHHPLPLPDPGLDQQRHFSAFSEPSNCPKCGARDAHYIRRLDAIRILPIDYEDDESSEGGSGSRDENDPVAYGMSNAGIRMGFGGHVPPPANHLVAA